MTTPKLVEQRIQCLRRTSLEQKCLQRLKIALSWTLCLLLTARAHGSGLGRTATLERGQAAARILDPAGGDVIQTLVGIVNQQQMNPLALQPVVVVQPPRVDQGGVALAVLGDDFLAPVLTCSSNSDKVARAYVKGNTSLSENAITTSVCLEGVRNTVHHTRQAQNRKDKAGALERVVRKSSQGRATAAAHHPGRPCSGQSAPCGQGFFRTRQATPAG